MKDHLVENYLKQSVITNVLKDYPDTCVLIIEGLMEIFEIIKKLTEYVKIKNIKNSLKASC